MVVRRPELNLVVVGKTSNRLVFANLVGVETWSPARSLEWAPAVYCWILLTAVLGCDRSRVQETSKPPLSFPLPILTDSTMTCKVF